MQQDPRQQDPRQQDPRQQDPARTLHVEIYAHGGWWKDSNGRTGQVPADQAKKGPLATVAMVANQLGMDGWALTQVQSQQHNLYRLSFQLAFIMEDSDDDQQPASPEQPATQPG